MTDTSSPAPPFGAPPSDGPAAPGIRILAQYIRDLGVELNAGARDGGLFEIELKLSASAKRDAEPVFQVELVYAGLFQIVGVEGDELEQVLLIEAPRYLFPFARRLIADLSAEGGFPPLMLEPIDFAAIYMARRAQTEGAMVGNA
jgi:preprotein translocase subunit SecB